eukprot:2809581-Prymnesium_polylepis.1
MSNKISQAAHPRLDSVRGSCGAWKSKRSSTSAPAPDCPLHRMAAHQPDIDKLRAQQILPENKGDPWHVSAGRHASDKEGEPPRRAPSPIRAVAACRAAVAP